MGELFLYLRDLSLKLICRYRKFVARFAANFQFPILIVLDRDLFIFSIHVWHFFDYFAASSIADCTAHVEGGNGFLEFLVHRAMSFSTFPIAVAYFRICFQFPFGKSHIKTADRHVNSVQLFRADSTPL